jgi:hypothetical protein
MTSSAATSTNLLGKEVSVSDEMDAGGEGVGEDGGRIRDGDEGAVTLVGTDVAA